MRHIRIYPPGYDPDCDACRELLERERDEADWRDYFTRSIPGSGRLE